MNSQCLSGCCKDNVCVNNVNGCNPGDTCGDGCQNGFETDVDCGGGTCEKCAPAQHCLDDADCMSNICQVNMGNKSCG